MLDLYFRKPEVSACCARASDALDEVSLVRQDLYLRPGKGPSAGDTRHVELIADDIREAIGVVRGPICDAILAIEHLGIPVVHCSSYASNSAISIPRGAVVLYGDGATPADLFFELVGLMLYAKLYKTGLDIVSEAMMRRIALAVLLPKSEIQREIGRAKPMGYPEPAMVIYLSRKYGLTIEQTINRLVQAGMLLPFATDMLDWEEMHRLAFSINNRLSSRVQAIRRLDASA